MWGVGPCAFRMPFPLCFVSRAHQCLRFMWPAASAAAAHHPLFECSPVPWLCLCGLEAIVTLYHNMQKDDRRAAGASISQINETEAGSNRKTSVYGTRVLFMDRSLLSSYCCVSNIGGTNIWDSVHHTHYFLTLILASRACSKARGMFSGESAKQRGPALRPGS